MSISLQMFGGKTWDVYVSGSVGSALLSKGVNKNRTDIDQKPYNPAFDFIQAKYKKEGLEREALIDRRDPVSFYAPVSERDLYFESLFRRSKLVAAQEAAQVRIMPGIYCE